MKSLFLIAALSAYTIAAALAPWKQFTPPPAGTTQYRIQAKSPTVSANGQFMQLPPTTSQNWYQLTKPGGPYAGTPSTFFLTKYAPTGTYALHNSDDTRQVALQSDGADASLLFLMDATDPSTDNIPEGRLMEWATFTNDGGVLGVSDGSALKNRTFVAVRATNDGWFLALYDGVTPQIEMITPVTLTLVKVE